MNEPTIYADNTISQSSQNGQSRLLARIIEPSGIDIAKIDETVLWSKIEDWVVDPSERHWQSQVHFTPTDKLDILTLIQMGDANLTTFDPIERIDDANNSGVRIGSFVACFNREESLRDSVSYTLHDAPASLRHFVADLVPGNYRLFVNGTSLQTLQVTKGDNSAWFETHTSGTLSIALNSIP